MGDSPSGKCETFSLRGEWYCTMLLSVKAFHAVGFVCWLLSRWARSEAGSSVVILNRRSNVYSTDVEQLINAQSSNKWYTSRVLSGRCATWTNPSMPGMDSRGLTCAPAAQRKTHQSASCLSWQTVGTACVCCCALSDVRTWSARERGCV